MMRHITILLVAILQCLASLRSEQVAGEQFDEAKGGGFFFGVRSSLNGGLYKHDEALFIRPKIPKQTFCKWVSLSLSLLIPPDAKL